MQMREKVFGVFILETVPDLSSKRKVWRGKSARLVLRKDCLPLSVPTDSLSGHFMLSTLFNTQPREKKGEKKRKGE